MFITNAGGRRAGRRRADRRAPALGDHPVRGAHRRAGLSVGRPLRKMGWHSSDTREVVLDGVAVGPEDVVGTENRGFHQIMEGSSSSGSRWPDGTGPRGRMPGPGPVLRLRARGVRRPARPAADDPAPRRGDGDRAGLGPAAHPPGRGPALLGAPGGGDLGGPGQVRGRDRGQPDRRRGRAAVRRSRVRRGVPGRPALPRRPDPADRGRNRRDPAGDPRQGDRRMSASTTGAPTRADVAAARERALAGGDASRWPGKMPVRDRLRVLFDPGTFVEDGPALRAGPPDLLPARTLGRRRRLHARFLRLGRDGRAPRLDDLASPRVAEKVTGERTTLEEMGGAQMHASVSGCGDEVFGSDWETVSAARLLLSYLPDDYRSSPARAEPVPPERVLGDVVPPDPNQAYDVRDVIEGVVDAGTFFEIKARWAREIVVGLARLEGRVVGLVANQPAVRSGAIFVDSADKAARFISLCDAFNVPLVFLQDVPGFMVGVEVERQGIIRHGAKMIVAMASAEVPKYTVVLRKAYAAGFYAMCAPGFEPRATLALPTATIGPMGAEASVNAVYANKIAAIGDDGERAAYVAARTAEQEADVNLLRMGSDLVVDAVVAPGSCAPSSSHG
ncbi:hypothetical protein L7F22_009744 [Adiantum nelumboides]|nr:hypothetical protein [Adiantum nelumboides]